MIFYLLAALLFLIGLYGVLVRKNLIKIVIGLSIMEYAVNLFFVIIGYRYNATAPIITKGFEKANFVDPLPQALVLTAIVIGLATTSLLIAICVRIYQKFGTFDVREIRRLRK